MSARARTGRFGRRFCAAWSRAGLSDVELVISDAHQGLREATTTASSRGLLGTLPDAFACDASPEMGERRDAPDWYPTITVPSATVAGPPDSVLGKTKIWS